MFVYLFTVVTYIQVVLKDFTLSLPEGKVTALCGLSGAGKSTVAALLERFYEPQGGQIFIDEYPLENLDPSWVRGEVIGYINQEPVLFGTSVMENIRYGRPDATNEEVHYIVGRVLIAVENYCELLSCFLSSEVIKFIMCILYWCGRYV